MVKKKRLLAAVMSVVLAVGMIPFGFSGKVKAEGGSHQLNVSQISSPINKGNTYTDGYFTVNASTKEINTDDISPKKINNVKYTHRLKLSAAGSKDEQNISFTTTEPYSIVSIAAISGSSSDSTRGLTLSDSDGNVIDANCVDGSAKNFIYYLPQSGTYYIYSDNSGINIYNINVEETNTVPQLKAAMVKAVSADGSAMISWDKVTGASSYEIYSSADNYTNAVKTISVTNYKESSYDEIYDETAEGKYSYKVKAKSDIYGEVMSEPSDEIVIDLSGEKKEKLDTSQWTYARVGTQSDSMDVPSYSEPVNTLVLNSKDKGKMANTGQSGMVMYYTKIKSSDYNATIRGRFHVTELKKADNQSSFGLIAFDSVGAGDNTTDYLNQMEIYAATKCEATGTTIPGIRTYLGNTDSTGKSNSDGTCDVTQYFNADATAFNSANATFLYYNFEIVKNCNGYVFNWYNDDWSNIDYTKTVYNPEKLLKQDNEYVYLGFYASRIGKVEVTDISYEQHEITEQEKSEIDKSLWVDYDTVVIKTFNGATTSSPDYTYRFKSNVTGTLTVKDDHGNTYINNKDIKADKSVEFKLSDYNIILPMGNTTFTSVVKPAENSVDADGNKLYSDRLLLKDYSEREVYDTVTRKTVGTENGNIIVSVSGNSNAKGTEEAPLDVYTALAYAAPGQTIILKDGTYNLNKILEIPQSTSGTSDKPIILKAENTGKAIFNGSSLPKSSDSVLFVKGSYWKIYGIDVCNSSDGTKGIHIAGHHNTIEMCNMYKNGSTGLQISYSGGEPSEWWPSYNMIRNCSSYYNCDSKQNDADGFAAKLSVGTGNTFDGCMSYNNADDGYDLYAKDKSGYGPISPVTIINCLAYNNGILENGSSSKASGNGFKLGGEGLTGKHVLKNCISWNNGGSGIMSNNGPDCQVYNCISVDNGYFSRTGGTKDRNNYQLTPKNGDKYSGNTGYVLENVISFYTDSIADIGTMASDKFTLKNQSDNVIYKANNYICKNIGTKICSNSEDEQVDVSWFESVDYNTLVPTRNADGSIDMHGLFVLTDKAPKGVGANMYVPVSGGDSKPSGGNTDNKPSDNGGLTGGSSNSGSNSNSGSDISDSKTDDSVNSKLDINTELKIDNSDKADVNDVIIGADMSKEDLIKAILTPEEIALASDKNVEIKVSIDSATELDSVTENLINESKGEYTLGTVLDINLAVMIDGSKSRNVIETNSPLMLKVKLSDKLINTDSALNREYKVIRIHDNKADVLETSYLPDDNTITFKTDRFSVYAIVYRDVKADGSLLNDSSVFGKSVQTSDNNNIWLLICVAMASLVVISITGYKKHAR